MEYSSSNGQYVNFQGVQQSVNQKQQKNNSKNFLKIFEIGLFEIVFIIIILGIFFGLLNYFNIINLPKIYAPLSALPKIQPTPLPSPMPTPFVYDNASDTRLISLYASQILLPQFQSITEGSDLKKPQRDQNSLSYIWSLDSKTTVTGKIFNKMQSNDYDYLQLSIESASTSALPQDATSSAQQILTNFFKPFAGTSPLACSQINGNQICQQFSTIPSGDIGQGIIWNKNNTYLLFACNIFPNSVYHQVKHSCLPLL